MSLDRYILRKESCALVIVDVQERLIKAMNGSGLSDLTANIERLQEAARLFDLPVIATEQYPRGLGHTIEPIRTGKFDECIEKVSFSCCGENLFVDTLAQKKIESVILVGMESHVCVYQTALDLLLRGYKVHLVKDAVCSRKKIDYQTSIANLSDAGAVVSTTEMILFQLLRGADAAQFKAISKLVKDA